jgi:glycosyltransferase involved in cell wall biosynthesis
MSARELSVLQVAAWYPPFNLGGTEIYIEGLIRELGGLGVKSTVLVPRDQDADETYVHAGTQVGTYRVNESPARNEIKEGKPHSDFDEFQAHLLKHRGAIYHQHSWTRGCGHHHLRAARELGFRTILTIHVPANICLRGTMVRFGEDPCDGRIEETRCGACWAQCRGAPKPLSWAMANLPLSMAKSARQYEARLATALSARALAAERLQHVTEMIANSDRIVAVCQWLYAALASNGVPSQKLVLSRQGVSPGYLAAACAAAKSRPRRKAPVRMLYLGRWDPNKGIDIVVRAVRSLPSEIALNLTIRAIPALGHRIYEEAVRALAKGDPRISIEPPVARNDLAVTLASCDALVVPSIWMETGPLVILEAQAAGLFVLGSRLGGIAELVDEGEAGELVEPGNVAAWARAIERLASRHRHGALPRPSRPVRTMLTAGQEMAALYRSLETTEETGVAYCPHDRS